MPKINLENVTYFYINKKTHVASAGLFEVNVAIPDRSFTIIEGPSGSGKTTLLKVIAGIYPPAEGTITYNDLDVTNTAASSRNIGYVTQEFVLYKNLTIFDNIAYPLKVAKVPLDERRERVQKMAELLDIELTLSRKPRVLSGGERQRVALARALIRRPDILLLDEPLSNLDAPLRSELLALIASLQKRLGMSVIMASHNVVETSLVADYIITMENGAVISILENKMKVKQ